MKILVFKDKKAVGKEAATYFKNHIICKPNSVLGLATGSTPTHTYNELIRLHKEEGLNFSLIKTFNLDEYCGISRDNQQSYYHIMKEVFFNHVNINPKNTHIPNGQAENLEKEAREYEDKIERAGGIDLQMLGIGVNAHIGYNEPDEELYLKSHVTTLCNTTLEANSRFFDSIDNVPQKAITMGVGTIFKSKRIILIATGKHKAQAVKDTVYGNIDPKVPSTILKLHPHVTLLLDAEAASLLDRKDYIKDSF